MFREMTKEELEAIEIHLERNYPQRTSELYGTPLVAFQKQGNFTIALIMTSFGVYTGVSKRMPEDAKNGKLGTILALIRAVDNGLLHKYGEGTAVTSDGTYAFAEPQ